MADAKEQAGRGQLEAAVWRAAAPRIALHTRKLLRVADDALQLVPAPARRRRGAEHSLGLLQQGRAPADGTKARK